MDAFDLFGDIDITDIVPIIILGAVQEAVSKVPRSTGLPGADYLDELLNCGNEKRIYSVLRMKKETFRKLCIRLEKDGGLRSTIHVSVNQQVAIFLWIINFSASMGSTAERFQHFTETISR
jgi:hypothetical protein